MNTAESGFRGRRRRETLIFLLLLVLWAVFALLLLICGDQNYSLRTLLSVIAGQEGPDASYAVRTIRIPRVLVGTAAGFAFGTAGNTFQKVMRNSLASPDVMGITTGASAAAIFSMMVLGMSGPAVWEGSGRPL